MRLTGKQLLAVKQIWLAHIWTDEHCPDPCWACRMAAELGLTRAEHYPQNGA